MTTLKLVPARSRVRLRTFAEGLFARLAHDLELECRELEVEAVLGSEGTGTATVRAAIARIEVVGTCKDGVCDPHGLSPSDRRDCEAKMRREVFRIESGEVRVEAALENGQGRARVVFPVGHAVEVRPVVTFVQHGETTRVEGKFDLALSAMGVGTIKGPMNAFRLKDRIEVLFALELTPVPS